MAQQPHDFTRDIQLNLIIFQAYRDARNAMSSDPTNKELQPLLARLHIKAQEKLKEQAKTSVKVEQMMDLAFDPSQDAEKRETAMKNMLVLAREPSGVEAMCQKGVMTKLKTVIKLEKNQEICVSAIRTLSAICQNSEKNVRNLKINCILTLSLISTITD
jgi:protein unc-45